MNRISAPADCPTCDVTQTVDLDEDDEATVEIMPCASCEAKLCKLCARWCDECGLPHCAAHLTDVSGSTVCGSCIREMVADGADEYEEAA
jgi:hypothetical protein